MPLPPDRIEYVDNGNEAQSPEGRTLRLLTAATVKPEPVDWLITNYVPKGAITLVSGLPGLGKSLLTLHWAADMTTGRLTGQPQDVLVIAVEDSPEHVIVPRLIAAGADLERVHFVQAAHNGLDAGSVVLPLDISRVRNIVREMSVGMVIIDPLSSALSPTLDTHKDASVRQALDPLSRLAADTQCAVIAIAHWNKSAGSDANSRVIGSRALVAVARSHIGVGTNRDNDRERIASLQKSNLGPLDVPGIGFAIETVPTPTGDMGRAVLTGDRDSSLAELADPADDSGEQQNVAAWLRGYLIDNGGEALKVDIEKAGRAAGYSPDQLTRARKKLGLVTEREKCSQPRTVWRLPLE